MPLCTCVCMQQNYFSRFRHESLFQQTHSRAASLLKTLTPDSEKTKPMGQEHSSYTQSNWKPGVFTSYAHSLGSTDWCLVQWIKCHVSKVRDLVIHSCLFAFRSHRKGEMKVGITQDCTVKPKDFFMWSSSKESVGVLCVLTELNKGNKSTLNLQVTTQNCHFLVYSKYKVGKTRNVRVLLPTS